jgi:hypothetical protein
MMLALTAKTQARTATKIILKNKKATREVLSSKWLYDGSLNDRC